MQFSVTNRFSNEVQFTAEIACEENTRLSVKLGLAVKWALENRANLSRANLSRANLSRANLSRANLYGANLSRANLYGANISGPIYLGPIYLGPIYLGPIYVRIRLICGWCSHKTKSKFPALSMRFVKDVLMVQPILVSVLV